MRSRAATRSQCASKTRVSSALSLMSQSNVVSLEMLLVSRSALTGRSSRPCASRHKRRPSSPRRETASRSSIRCKSPISAKAQSLQSLPPNPADAPQAPDAQRREPGFRFVSRKQCEAARLVEIGGEFRQKLAVAEADRNRHADIDFDSPGKARRAFQRRLLRWSPRSLSDPGRPRRSTAARPRA